MANPIVKYEIVQGASLSFLEKAVNERLGASQPFGNVFYDPKSNAWCQVVVTTLYPPTQD